MKGSGRFKGNKSLEEFFLVLQAADPKKREQLLRNIESSDPGMAKLLQVRLKQERKAA